jgi:hypothetical protein
VGDFRASQLVESLQNTTRRDKTSVAVVSCPDGVSRSRRDARWCEALDRYLSTRCTRALSGATTHSGSEDRPTLSPARNAALRRRWADLIRRVYEVDPWFANTVEVSSGWWPASRPPPYPRERHPKGAPSTLFVCPKQGQLAPRTPPVERVRLGSAGPHSRALVAARESNCLSEKGAM